MRTGEERVVAQSWDLIRIMHPVKNEPHRLSLISDDEWEKINSTWSYYCSSCDNCTACLPKWYGDNCTRPCSSSCSFDGCNKTTGKCFNCEKGYFGDFCHKPCPPSCKDRLCSRDGLSCLDDSIDGYSGPTSSQSPATPSGKRTLLIWF